MKQVLFAVVAVLSLAACKVENTRVERSDKDAAQKMENQANRMENQADKMKKDAQDVRSNNSYNQ